MVTENKKDKYSLTNYRLGNDAVQIRKQIFFRFFKDLNFIANQNFVTFSSIFQCQIKAEIFKKKLRFAWLNWEGGGGSRKYAGNLFSVTYTKFAFGCSATRVKIPGMQMTGVWVC